MKRITIVCALGLAMFTMAICTPAYGVVAELDSPAVAIPQSVPMADRERIQNALRREDATFISGGFLNKHTHLHYKGDTAALGKFLDELSKCPSAKVWIGFYKPGPDVLWAPETSTWSVFHSATDNSFTVKIRLGSDIDLTKLYVPPLKAELTQIAE